MPPAPRSKPPEKRPASPAERARATRSLLFSVPGEHFQLVPVGEAVMCVARVSPEQALREPYATLSREQLGGLLYESGTPVVSGAALAGYLSSLHPVPAFDRHVPGRFAQDPGMSRLSQSTWRGSLGELSAQHQGWFPQQDLNAVRYNYPIFDLRDPQGGLNSVKTSVRVSEAGDPFATYLRGLGDVLGRRSGALERVRQDLYSHLPRPQGEAAVIRNGYISVNEDHVEPLRAALRDPANYQRQVYRDLADQLLEKLGPARVGGKVYRDYASLERALREAASNSAVRAQLEAALRAVREGLASRVQGNGITTQHLVRLLRFRLQLARANPHMTPEQFKGWAFPELVLVARQGGGLWGNLGAAGVSGGRGAVGGAMVSVVLESGCLVYDWYPDCPRRVLSAGLAGGAAGWVGGTTQSLVAGSAGSALSRSLVTHGFNPALATSAGRGLGGLAAGGLAAPVFAATSLALDDQEHGVTDYAATGARAFVAGTLSSALAAGVVGAIWGSEVPVAGNIVGFIVGFTGYYIIDALTGEQVEQGVRQGLQGTTGGSR